ncbi:LysR family transcriptional regulator [Allopusillimonas ginsengisoli]|nr:LysR family transcriptional regulator [Allopusillimonas ginsengisoli]
MNDSKSLRLKGSIWLTSGNSNVGGHGRIDLLARIAELGSISQAAKTMGMSYKTAWDAVDHMNALAGQPLIERSVGGKGGGSTELTERGKRLVTNFRILEKEHQRFLDDLGKHIHSIADVILVPRRISMKTSARNHFAGVISSIKRGAVNDEVELEIPGGQKITASITHGSVESLGLKAGDEAFALVKASSVILVADARKTRFSARNCLSGKIATLRPGAVNTEVIVNIDQNSQITAVITNESATTLDLATGHEVSALFKASSVIIGIPA